ncbi:MAG: NlpC/P60 family protein [Christensenellales bacterium]
MFTIIKNTCILLIISVLALTSGCALSAEETERERAYYEYKYENEEQPQGDIERLLTFLDGCVGGQYIFGGQGHAITDSFIDSTYKIYPDYFDGGRLEYLRGIARSAQLNGHRFPQDYAWDCSGLWWYAANELELYEEYTDKTAHDTYYDFCNPITKEELRPGDIVFVTNAEGRVAHMGIVGRHGFIYEAVSGFAGVVLKRTVDKRVYNDIVRGGVLQNNNWNTFGRPKIFE